MLARVFESSFWRRIGLVLIVLGLLQFLPTTAKATNALPAPVQRSSDLELNLMRTGRNSDSSSVRRVLEFRVEAFDPAVGDDDGDGIDYVDMFVVDIETNEVVYAKREQRAGYCAFGGGTPNCSTLRFEESGYRWPNPRGGLGKLIEDGADYRLIAIATAEDGRQARMNEDVRIELDNSSSSSDIELRVMRTGRSNRSSTVDDELQFRVEAFDPDVGEDDGDGIRAVDMVILNSENEVVYANRESRAGYCAFGGGTPNCRILDFQDSGFRWPSTDGRDGQRIEDNGDYRLVAIATSDDGRVARLDTDVTVRF